MVINAMINKAESNALPRDLVCIQARRNNEQPADRTLMR